MEAHLLLFFKDNGLVTSIIVNPERYKSSLVCDPKLFWVIWSSDQACTVDALAVRGDEGRGNLRKGSGSR